MPYDHSTGNAGVGEEEKEEIIREFLPYIKYTASRLLWRLPPQFTIDDLISAGLIGLMDAVDKYDTGRGKLKTYAEFRIKGAMLDELRSSDWVPRSTKKKVNDIKSAHSQLEKEFGRMPDDEEVAEALDLSLEEYYKTLYEASGSISFRFEDFEADSAGDDKLNILECIPDTQARDPLALLEEGVRRETLAKLIDGLPEKEKLLLSLYYWDELTMKEIGKVMKLTEGRVCQIHTQALIRMKAKLENNT